MKKLILASTVALLLVACQQAEHTADKPAETSQPTEAHADGHAADANVVDAHHAANTHGDVHDDAHGHGGHEHVDLPVADTPAPALEESVYLVEGDWKDENGNVFDLNSLAGKKQVVAFIYTSCREVCPLMMRSMKTIQDQLPADVQANTGFLVVSFDPERDTPAILKNFGEHYKTDEHWVFLNGSDDDVRMLANTMNIRYQFADQGMINHSNVLTVLDENGKMIEQAHGTSKAGEDAVIQAVS